MGLNTSTPVSGDLWWNGTNLFFYNGTTNIDLLSGSIHPWTIQGNDIYYNTGKVAIGTGAPGTTLFHVQENLTGQPVYSADTSSAFSSSDNTAISIISGNSHSATLNFGDDGDEDIGAIFYNHSTNSLTLRTNTTNQLQIDSSGVITVFSLAGGGTQCLQVDNSGVVSRTGSGCGQALPSLTKGSVIFSNGSTLSEDNANFFWDEQFNLLRIGATFNYPNGGFNVASNLSSTSSTRVNNIYALFTSTNLAAGTPVKNIFSDTNITNAPVGGEVQGYSTDFTINNITGIVEYKGYETGSDFNSNDHDDLIYYGFYADGSIVSSAIVNYGFYAESGLEHGIYNDSPTFLGSNVGIGAAYSEFTSLRVGEVGTQTQNGIVVEPISVSSGTANGILIENVSGGFTNYGLRINTSASQDYGIHISDGGMSPGHYSIYAGYDVLVQGEITYW